MGAGGGDQVQLLFVLEEELGFSLGKATQLIHVMEIPGLRLSLECLQFLSPPHWASLPSLKVGTPSLGVSTCDGKETGETRGQRSNLALRHGSCVALRKSLILFESPFPHS